MVQPTKEPANSFVRVTRKVYNPIGFSKGYNFVLWFIFAGALFGFTLARLQYYNYNGIFCADDPNATASAAPGECFYFSRGHYRVGMMIHLFTILPASLLVVLQFVPAIRHKKILFHRINGYLILILVVVSIAGAIMTARHAFGGSLATQGWLGVLAIMSIGSLAMAYINIKRLQIDQHRKWMLRAWFYMASIITLRLVFFLAALIVNKFGGYYTVWSCAKILFTQKNDQARLVELYPECASYINGTNINQQAVVTAKFDGRVEQIGAILDEAFATGGWIALWLHAIGIEIYIRLTPAESERLRQVSYERQLEAGFRNPGKAGLTADRLGDSEPWTPLEDRKHNKTLTSHGSIN